MEALWIKLAFGAKMILFAVWSLACLYVGCRIGANSPQTFNRNSNRLEKIAQDAMAKAKELAQRGR